MKYFLDTYALIEISEGNRIFDKYIDSEAVTLKNNLVELASYLLRNYNEETALLFLERFSKITVSLPYPVIIKAAKLKIEHKHRFSYNDCLGYTYALENNCLFLTGDRTFKGMRKAKIVR